jgi:outer membrane protein OmpA-like peptidoglycan-associated protein
VSIAVCFAIAPVARAQEVDASVQARLPVHAGRFSLKIETGVAIPLTRPQSQIFSVGGSQSIKGLFALTPYLDLGPSATFVGLPAEQSENKGGTAWAFGGSLQLKRPHHAAGNAFQAISPWVDVDLMYVRTDQLNRAGLAAAVGVSVPLGAARVFWLGPFVRFFEIINAARSGFNDNDARILSVGLSLEVSAPLERPYESLPSSEPQVRTVEKEVPCPDRDGDKIPDNIDRCPEVVGPMDNWGCRQYEKLVVKPDKLELKEKLYFAWDQNTLQPVSFPVLDEVVQALQENKNFRVQVEGHTSSDGTDEHNQRLSEQRAQAVLDYLVTHGVAKERLVSKGFASSVPLDTNTTVAGRESNRRVEFVVNFNIVENGSK